MQTSRKSEGEKEGVGDRWSRDWGWKGRRVSICAKMPLFQKQGWARGFAKVPQRKKKTSLYKLCMNAGGGN